MMPLQLTQLPNFHHRLCSVTDYTIYQIDDSDKHPTLYLQTSFATITVEQSYSANRSLSAILFLYLTVIHNVTSISQVFSQFHETEDIRGQTATPETVHCRLIVVNVYHGLCLDAKVAQILCKSGTSKKRE